MHTVSNILVRRTGPAARLMLALAIVAAGFGPATIGPAFADHPNGRHFLWWTFEGDLFATYGANAEITIALGAIEFIPDCGAVEDGVNDDFHPNADIYVVPSGTIANGSALQDVSVFGIPNTVIGTGDGTIGSESIGFTKPAGRIGPGTYAVVYDECRDGRFQSTMDFMLDPAFEVVIPANVPPLDSAGDAIVSLKVNAAKQALIWAAVYASYSGLFWAAEKALEVGGGDSGVETESSGGSIKDELIDELVNMLKEKLQAIIEEKYDIKIKDPKKAALAQISAMIFHWLGIAADPPDPQFAQPSPLGVQEVINPGTGDLVVATAIDVGTAAGRAAVVAEALLRSLERYQGADAANDGDWALLHARAIQHYALLLASQLPQTDTALAVAAAALAADTRPLDEAANELEALRTRVAASGLSADELRALRNLGLTETEIADLQSYLLALDLENFSKGGTLTGIAQVEAETANTVSGLNELAGAMGSIIAALEVDPGVAGLAPLADAGGPYSGIEDSPVVFSGLTSTGRLTNTLYEWDLDGDGAFDDADEIVFYGTALTDDIYTEQNVYWLTGGGGRWQAHGPAGSQH